MGWQRLIMAAAACVGAAFWGVTVYLDPPDSIVPWVIAITLFAFVAVLSAGVCGILFGLYELRRASLARRMVLLLCYVAAYVSIFSFMYPFIISLGVKPWATRSMELPLGGEIGIAVDGEGRVYLSTGSYSRIQVYDRHGRFLRGWFGAASDDMRINKEGNLEVHWSGMGSSGIATYTPRGKLISKTPTSGDFNLVPDERRYRRVGPNKSVYTLRGSWFGPHVMKYDSSGSKTTIISVPWHNWFWMFPLPGFLWFFVAWGVMWFVLPKEWM